jgi:hypothetical protein
MTLVKQLTIIAEINVYVIEGRGLGYDPSGNIIHLTFRNRHVATQNACQHFTRKKKLNISLLGNPQVFPKVTSPITFS